MFTSSPIKRELLEEKKHLIGFAASACVGTECFHFGLCTTNLCNTKQNLLDITNLSYTSKTRKTTTTTSKTTSKTTTAAAAATAEKTTTTAATTTTTTKEQQKKISNSAKRIFDFKQILLSITLLIVSRW